MSLKLWDSLRHSGSALFLDRDIQTTKGEFGQVLYDQVTKSFEHDFRHFVSTEDDPLIVAVRPALLETHREVKALEMKRAEAQKVLDEQAVAQQEAEKNCDNYKPKASQFWGASGDKWTTAKYKTQIALCEDKIRKLKQAFGNKVYYKLVLLEQTHEDWQPSDPLVQTAWQICRENVERLEKLKSSGISFSPNHNGHLEDQVASTLASLSTPLGQEPTVQESASVARKNTRGRHIDLENQVVAALASLEVEHMVNDEYEAQTNEQSESVSLGPPTKKEQPTELRPEGSRVSENGIIAKDQVGTMEVSGDEPALSVEEEPHVDQRKAVADVTVDESNDDHEACEAKPKSYSERSKEVPSEIDKIRYVEASGVDDEREEALMSEGVEDVASDHTKADNNAPLSADQSWGKAHNEENESKSNNVKVTLGVSKVSETEERSEALLNLPIQLTPVWCIALSY